ncbi:hypothetical protein TNCV_2354421 [Trichonephila clavipes]|nr:hypothetical protein TNCV_2354421 [Trichonephila clavipes]
MVKKKTRSRLSHPQTKISAGKFVDRRYLLFSSRFTKLQVPDSSRRDLIFILKFHPEKCQFFHRFDIDFGFSGDSPEERSFLPWKLRYQSLRSLPGPPLLTDLFEKLKLKIILEI